nr:unnamed protein product [Digitaria exilis]
MATAAAFAGAAHVLPGTTAATAAATPAARFWDQALPGSHMPNSIAELVQKGIDRSPLKEERDASPYIQPSACLGYTYQITCGKPPPQESSSSSASAFTPAGLFFHESQIRTGAAMTVSFPPASVRPILPLSVAKNVPFAAAAAVLAIFSIPPRSDAAAQVRSTLLGCRAPPLAGETKACATSLEATVRAATTMLMSSTAGDGEVVWAAASAVPRGGVPRREYAVAAVAALDGDRHVACHDEPFPYAVFQCHMTGQSTTRAYMMTLSGGGQDVAMAALCHRDTSSWNPAHPAFEVLETKPGGAPVCHFMPYANMVFGVKD